MSNSTTLLDLISSSQSGKEVTSNALDDALSPASLFGRRASTTAALTWGYYGGPIYVDGVLTSIANGTVALSASNTNYVQSTRAGVVSTNTAGFAAGQIPLYEIVAGASTVTSYTDYRITKPIRTGRLVLAMADANKVLTSAQANNEILEMTGAITALRDVIVPLAPQQWTVFANVTGGFGVRVIGATGTGITIADGKRAIVYSDSTNIVRVSADV